MTTLTLPARIACPVCGVDQPITKVGAIRKHKAGRSGAEKSLPCEGGGRLVGAARIPRRSTSGFYKCHVTGRYLRSVTTILNQGSPKPALVPWAAGRAAELAIEHAEDLVEVKGFAEPRGEAYRWLRDAHVRIKDERADLGSAVHRIIEARVLGEPMPADVVADPQMAPFVASFERFVADWEVEFTASEMVVANYAESYAGTLDYLFRSRPLARRWGVALNTEFMGDTKTGGELDERTYDGNLRGVYPEAGVQQAAYRKGQFCWLRDGTRVSMPITHDVGLVLHLRPEGYRLIPVRCGDEVFNAFRSMRRVADFHADLAKHVVGAPLTPPGTTAERAA